MATLEQKFKQRGFNKLWVLQNRPTLTVLRPDPTGELAPDEYKDIPCLYENQVKWNNPGSDTYVNIGGNVDSAEIIAGGAMLPISGKQFTIYGNNIFNGKLQLDDEIVFEDITYILKLLAHYDTASKYHSAWGREKL